MLDSRERLELEFGILGPLRLTVNGDERALAGDKLRGLLAMLLLEAPRPVSASRLVDDLWGEEPPATARQSLHVHVARLRRALAADGLEHSPLETSPRGYLLHVEDDQLDAARFRRLVAGAREARRAGGDEEAADRYRSAHALWRGEALEDVALPSLEPARSELEALRLSALEERIEIELKLGRTQELVAELEELVARHPLREGLRAQLMRALYATGRQAEALDAYRDARRELDDLGLVPGPALRELEQAILRQDADLVAPRLPTGSAGTPSAPARARRRWLAVALGGRGRADRRGDRVPSARQPAERRAGDARPCGAEQPGRDRPDHEPRHVGDPTGKGSGQHRVHARRGVGYDRRPDGRPGRPENAAGSRARRRARRPRRGGDAQR